MALKEELRSEHYKNRLSAERRALFELIRFRTSVGKGVVIFPVYRDHLPFKSFKQFMEDLNHLLEKTAYTGIIKLSEDVAILSVKLNLEPKQLNNKTTNIPEGIKHIFESCAK